MNKRIITISREFGSGGREIGRRTAEKLGWRFYDKEIIGRLAEETGLSRQFIEKHGEYAPSKSIFAYSFVERDNTGRSMADYLNHAQNEIILSLAEEEPCVIVGRCADDILRGRPDTVNVFIHGEPEAKCRRVAERYQLTPAQAEKRMKEMDKKRSVHYNYYTHQEWGRAQNYTLTLDSSVLGVEKCVEIICGL